MDAADSTAGNSADDDSAERNSGKPGKKSTRRRFLRGAAVVGGLGLLAGGGLVGHYVATLYSPRAEPHRGRLALTGATVLVGEDLEPRTDTTVLVTDGVITEISDDGDFTPSADTETVDLSGHTLMPGLIDLHVHLGFPQQEPGDELGATDMPGVVYEMARYVPSARRALLEHGVTTVRGLGDDHTWIIEMRRMLRDGDLEGPRLYTSGPLFTTPAGHPVATFGVEPDSGTVRLPSTPEEAREAVRELASGDDPVDLVKVVQERGDTESMELDPIPTEILEAIVAEAHEHGLTVTAHWGSEPDLTDALAAGVDGLEHLESRGVLDGWPEELLAELVERDIPVTPTLAVTEVAVSAEEHRVIRDRLAELYEAGGRIVAGSDAAVPGVRFGDGLHRELELLADSGLGPHAALRAATSEAARVLGTDHIGAIEVGRAADLLALTGDPLADISRIREVASVYRDGRQVV
ncbi:amidohydrolase family protein [Nocardiopsis valliformis]|uniref:amidohydrolase family protein n=1 Tax=Nocardiopsis valliformis TaxID=239974 RepID=UPI0003475E86|nr:amidohydrolase family protein [Nocardiopsis valliformis]